MKKLLFLALLSTSLLCFAQNTVGTILNTEDAYEGFTLFSTHNSAFLIDNCGQVINRWDSQYPPGNAVYLLPNGDLLRAGRYDVGSNLVSVPGNGGIVELFDWDGNLKWSYIDSSSSSRLHHDVYPMPNGNILLLSATVLTATEAIQAGRDPNLLDSNELYNERIYEVEPVGTNQINVVWEWNVIDHVIQDFDITRDNYGVVALNPGKVDINFLNNGLTNSNGDPVWDPINNWLHINAIQYDEELDQILISSRRLSEIWAIDHSINTAQASGPAGDLLYRWGNPQAYDQGTEADRQLYGQHTPYYIPTGFPNERKIMIFNNGFHREPLYSEVLIIDPPVDGNDNYTYTPNTAYGPTNTDFRFPETAPTTNSDFYSGIISSARQLPNGNILVCEGRGSNGARFFEIDENNQLVWEYISPINNANGDAALQGSVGFSGGFTFRAEKYGLDYPAFTGRDLTPSAPLEGNPDIASCLSILSNDTFNKDIVSVYPNPTTDFVNINSNSPLDKIELLSVTGKKLNVYDNTNKIDISSLNRGVYFLKVYSENRFISKKIIKQ